MLANDLPQCELANSFFTLSLFYAITMIAHRKMGTVPGWVGPHVRNGTAMKLFTAVKWFTTVKWFTGMKLFHRGEVIHSSEVVHHSEVVHWDEVIPSW